jgi:predicted outer membrane repeat protein
MTLVNGVVVGNHAGLLGGGLALVDSATALYDVAIADNSAAQSGGGIHGSGSTASLAYCDCNGNLPDAFDGVPDPTGQDGNLAIAPGFLDLTPTDPLAWDLHLQISSPLVDAGDPALADPDGSPGDIGAFGGPFVADRDLDHDGYPVWWQPGVYDPALYPALGWDCDDLDATVTPVDGC